MASESACTRFSKYRTKDDKLHRLFVYGTLKTGQPNHFHFEEVEQGEICYYGKYVQYALAELFVIAVSVIKHVAALVLSLCIRLSELES